MKKQVKGKYCVENVMAYYKPLIEPQRVGRHWYWANFPIENMQIAPTHISQQSKRYSKSPVKIFKASDYEKLYGYDLSPYKIRDKRLLMRNCVEPSVGKHILDCAIKSPSLFASEEKQEAKTLFFLQPKESDKEIKT